MRAWNSTSRTWVSHKQSAWWLCLGDKQFDVSPLLSRTGHFSSHAVFTQRLIGVTILPLPANHQNKVPQGRGDDQRPHFIHQHSTGYGQAAWSTGIHSRSGIREYRGRKGLGSNVRRGNIRTKIGFVSTAACAASMGDSYIVAAWRRRPVLASKATLWER